MIATLSGQTDAAAAGFAAARLGRIDDALRRWVNAGELAGAVTLLARRGHTAHIAAVGQRDREAGAEMAPDALFRIFSMTKPVTVTAVLLLFEEGRFLLDDPIADYLPAFAATKVFVRETPGGFETADLERPITIRHLLTHTAGTPYPNTEGTLVERLYALESSDQAGLPLGELVTRIAALPLAHQPGAGYTYGVGHDILARFVEVLSGQSYDTFLRERIFAPLGMHETGFQVPAKQAGRIAAVYTPAGSDGLSRVSHLDRRDVPAFPAGGHGLFSTAADYARFSQMLLNHGALPDGRLLGRKTVELLAADQVVALADAGLRMALGVYRVVDIGAFGLPASVGSFGWSGAASTHFWIDPAEDMFGIFLTQRFPYSLRWAKRFQALAYGALAE